jgi:hypothetical protein
LSTLTLKLTLTLILALAFTGTGSDGKRFIQVIEFDQKKANKLREKTKQNENKINNKNILFVGNLNSDATKDSIMVSEEVSVLFCFVLFCFVLFCSVRCLL